MLRIAFLKFGRRIGLSTHVMWSLHVCGEPLVVDEVRRRCVRKVSESGFQPGDQVDEIPGPAVWSLELRSTGSLSVIFVAAQRNRPRSVNGLRDGAVKSG